MRTAIAVLFAFLAFTSSIATADEIAAKKIDEFSGLKPADEEARLDMSVIQLQGDPAAQLAIISYGGKKARPGDAQKGLDRVKKFLVEKRGVDAGRITSIDGGKRAAPTIELWLVPSGAAQPIPTPTVVDKAPKKKK